MSEKNPWVKKGSREVYKNPWIRLREDSVIRPDGSDGIYSVVEARFATGVVAVNAEGKIILVGQYRYAVEEYSWEIIEGGAEVGETPLEAIKRELVEEGGVKASKWQPLGGEIMLSNCFTNERGYLFLAEDLEEVPKDPDGTEVLSLRYVTLEEALQMIAVGEIKDAMTIIGIMRYAESRKK